MNKTAKWPLDHPAMQLALRLRRLGHGNSYASKMTGISQATIRKHSLRLGIPCGSPKFTWLRRQERFACISCGEEHLKKTPYQKWCLACGQKGPNRKLYRLQAADLKRGLPIRKEIGPRLHVCACGETYKSKKSPRCPICRIRWRRRSQLKSARLRYHRDLEKARARQRILARRIYHSDPVKARRRHNAEAAEQRKRLSLCYVANTILRCRISDIPPQFLQLYRRLLMLQRRHQMRTGIR